ncbi:MAG: hypothetical protein COS08_01565, partial [Euryarchaeota archaeon CG01_land_8_20_14_3_00_38_12]
MTNLGKEILDFLATPSLKDGRKSLYKLLGADENEANVYYLVPLLNLKSIICDEGIKCREEVGKDAEDLSGQEVQAKRDASLKLARILLYDFDIKQKKI